MMSSTTETTPLNPHYPQRSCCDIISDVYGSLCRKIQNVALEITRGMSWALACTGFVGLCVSASGFRSYSSLISVPTWTLIPGGAFVCVVSCVSAVCLRRLTIPNMNPLLNSIADDIENLSEKQSECTNGLKQLKDSSIEQNHNITNNNIGIEEIRLTCQGASKDFEERNRNHQMISEKDHEEMKITSEEREKKLQSSEDRVKKYSGPTPSTLDETQKSPGESERPCLQST